MTTARRRLEARATRDAEVATTHQAQPVGPEHDTAAQQAGSPMDGETGFRRCFLWPQRLRGLPLVRVSPLREPYCGMHHSTEEQLIDDETRHRREISKRLIQYAG